ncbi:hypothetical protein [Bradyrhizobium sp. Ash2021]|nr:hypothetical protein [Bradyrhizobium sp. Ash2021]WMT74491.1 hypothetical protein NL528_42555 [Bradyrhizobium sp. Ash2021]
MSKHWDRAYRAGRCSNWIKIKNPASAAMVRAEEGEMRTTGREFRAQGPS